MSVTSVVRHTDARPGLRPALFTVFAAIAVGGLLVAILSSLDTVGPGYLRGPTVLVVLIVVASLLLVGGLWRVSELLGWVPVLVAVTRRGQAVLGSPIRVVTGRGVAVGPSTGLELGASLRETPGGGARVSYDWTLPVAGEARVVAVVWAEPSDDDRAQLAAWASKRL